MKYLTSKFYYVNYHILGQCLWLTARTWNLRLWLMVSGLVILYFVHQAILLVLRLIDELVYPAYKQVTIQAPVFVIANPRSGTTYLQRLLGLDSTHYTYMRLLDTLFPAVCFHKFIRAVHRLDQRIGRPLGRLLGQLDKRFFRGWDDIHPMGFTAAEEDENLFVLTLTSPGIFLLFPFLDQVTEHRLLDTCPPAVRTQVMDFYEDSIQRFLYATGPHKTYLAKNVLSSGRIHTLRQRFPDAKLVYIARHPYAALPSFVSMFTAMYKVHSPVLPSTAPAYRAWAQLGIDFYRHCLHVEEGMPDQAFYPLHYEALVQAPVETVWALFRFFHWQPSAPFLSLLAQEQRRQATYRSRHHYSLEQYGLQKAEIDEALREVFVKYNWSA
ncbi:MAG: sulfotransferase [Caldilineaceae bacterium]